MTKEIELTHLLPNGLVNLHGDGENTVIQYMYRDADNYKMSGRVIFDGRITEAQVRRLAEALDDGSFIPGQVGIEDLQEKFNDGKGEWIDDRDHPWHEVTGISYTHVLPEEDRHVGEFVDQVAKTTWDPKYLPEAHAEMVERHEKRAAREALEE